MELHEFVSATLLNIQRGVQNAITAALSEKLNGAINPSWRDMSGAAVHDVQKVCFDIAVTVSDKSSLGVGSGISVLGVKLGVDGTTAGESSHVSRIQFTVPIVPPTTMVEAPK